MILWSTPGGLSLLSDLVFFPIRLISAPEIDPPLGDKGRLERLQKKPSFVSRVPQLRIICQHILLSTTLPVLVHSSLGHSPNTLVTSQRRSLTERAQHTIFCVVEAGYAV